jgi:heme exporter protein B
VGLRQGSALLPVIIMPLMIPVLILATQAIASPASGHAYFLWLGALLSFSLTFLPLAIAASLKVAVSR